MPDPTPSPAPYLLPAQAEIRDRIHEAMHAAGLTDIQQLADRTPYDPATLSSLGQGRVALPAHLLHVARACKVPYAWFVAPRLDDQTRSALLAAGG